MEYDPIIHHRRSIRLAGHDYSQAGAYFVKTCVQDRRCLFGQVLADGTMALNAAGGVVAEEWTAAVAAYPGMGCDAHVVMPNHFHGIVVFTDNIAGAVHIGAIHVCPPEYESPLQPPLVGKRRGMGLAKLMGRFKMRSAKRINLLLGMPGATVWQRNYYEHIIRNETEWDHIRAYIETNPARWEEDRENPVGKIEKQQ